MYQVTASLCNLTLKIAHSLLLQTVNNHLGMHSILLKQQGESFMYIPKLRHGKCMLLCKRFEKYLGILVVTLGVGYGKQSVTENIMLQPPVSQLPVIHLEMAAQRGMEHCPESLLIFAI